jgi:hypothetical protein
VAGGGLVGLMVLGGILGDESTNVPTAGGSTTNQAEASTAGVASEPSATETTPTSLAAETTAASAATAPTQTTLPATPY